MANPEKPRPFAARTPVKPESTPLVEWAMWLAAFLIPEAVALASHHLADTLSESVRFAMGPTYGWRWVLLGGIVTGVCAWLPPHFLYYVGPRWLVALTVAALVVLAVVALIKP